MCVFGGYKQDIWQCRAYAQKPLDQYTQSVPLSGLIEHFCRGSPTDEAILAVLTPLMNADWEEQQGVSDLLLFENGVACPAEYCC